MNNVAQLVAAALRPPRRRRRSRGMTLVEIMVVVVIISLIVGVVGTQVFGRLKKAQREIARTQIKTISEALELYKLSMRNFPNQAEGLGALLQPKGGEEPFLRNVPKDPWGNPYVYIYPGTHNAGNFDLFSYGPDGVQGGEDDIGNWDTPAGE